MQCTITFLKGPLIPRDHLHTACPQLDGHAGENPLLALDTARDYLAACTIPDGTTEVRISIEFDT